MVVGAESVGNLKMIHVFLIFSSPIYGWRTAWARPAGWGCGCLRRVIYESIASNVLIGLKFHRESLFFLILSEEVVVDVDWVKDSSAIFNPMWYPK